MPAINKSLRQVAHGTGMMLAAIVLMFLYALVWMLLLPLAANLGSANVAMTLVRVQLSIGAPIFMTATLLGTIGPCLCLAAPRESRATNLILLSICMSALSLLVRVLTLVTDLPAWIALIASLCALLAVFFFVLFVIRLARFLERKDIVTLAKTSLTLTGIAVLLGIVPVVSMLVAAAIDLPRNAYRYLLPVTLICLVAALIISLIAFSLYLRTLVYTRRALLGGPPPKPVSATRKRIRYIVMGVVIGAVAGSVYYAAPVSLSAKAQIDPVFVVLAGAAVGGLCALTLIALSSLRRRIPVTRNIRVTKPIGFTVMFAMVAPLLSLPVVPTLGWNARLLITLAIAGALVGALLGLRLQSRDRRKTDELERLASKQL